MPFFWPQWIYYLFLLSGKFWLDFSDILMPKLLPGLEVRLHRCRAERNNHIHKTFKSAPRFSEQWWNLHHHQTETLSAFIFIQESLKQPRNPQATFGTPDSHLSGKTAKHPQTDFWSSRIFKTLLSVQPYKADFQVFWLSKPPVI